MLLSIAVEEKKISEMLFFSHNTRLKQLYLSTSCTVELQTITYNGKTVTVLYITQGSCQYFTSKKSRLWDNLSMATYFL